MALALAVCAFGYLRLGPSVGLHLTAAALVFAGLEAILSGARPWALRALAIVLQLALVAGVAFGPAPWGYAADIPGPMLLQSPLPMLLFCLLASYASSVDPLLMAFAAFALAGVWWLALHAVQIDPATLTRRNLRIGDYHTPLELMRAVNRPHYMQTDLIRFEFSMIAVVGAVLWLAAFRTRRLARRSARLEAVRNALSAHFSPQVVAVMAEADPGLEPRRRALAVLDCDLVAFSGEAETVAPETVAGALAFYRNLVARAVFAHGGAILGSAGDGVIALFGLTGDGETAAADALAAARALRHAWRDAAPPPGLQALPRIALGVDAGETLVGVVGQGRALSLLAQGPAVEGAARLQADTREAGVDLLISVPAAERAGVSDLVAVEGRAGRAFTLA